VERYNGNGRWEGKKNIAVGMLGWKKRFQKRFMGRCEHRSKHVETK
jgi:hypothetical protein